jgi:hypothetical protein
MKMISSIIEVTTTHAKIMPRYNRSPKLKKSFIRLSQVEHFCVIEAAIVKVSTDKIKDYK